MGAPLAACGTMWGSNKDAHRNRSGAVAWQIEIDRFHAQRGYR